MRRAVMVFSLGIVLGGLVAVPVGATAPVRAHQHFIGQVNGAHRNAVVQVVCPGPVGPVQSGPVAGGQTVAVLKKATGSGDTGLFSTIYAWFVPGTGGTAPTELPLTSYRTPVSVPTSIDVPCGGSGAVEFSSCPYRAPCAAGWTPYVVDVTFENIAV